MVAPTKNSLFTADGKPRFLDSADRKKFIDQASTAAVDIYMICKTLHDTGCSTQELLMLTKSSIVIEDRALIVKTAYPKAKKKDFELPKSRSRIIPIDLSLTMLYSARFELSNFNPKENDLDTTLWNVSTHSVSKIVKDIMSGAGITGAKANPRGLKHSLPIHLLREPNLLPIDIVKKLMGHTTLGATAKYLNLQMNRNDNQLFLNAVSQS